MTTEHTFDNNVGAAQRRSITELTVQQKKTFSKSFEDSFSYIKHVMTPYIPNFKYCKGKLLTQFNILLDLCGPSATMLDLGCGHGFLAMIMSSIGWNVTGIDNLQDYKVNYETKEARACMDADNRLWSHFGINFIQQNIYNEMPFDDNIFDVVVLSDVLEHLHNSPKPLIENAVGKLKKGGYLLIQTPNATNIKKRVKVLCGRTNYPPLEDWYFNGFPWVGHVREPTLSELKRILGYCNLAVHSAGGHNWTNRRRSPALVQSTANIFARVFPSLAAHIYVVGKKCE